MSENKYPIGGYALGNYINRCCDCGQSFKGDKRAVQCETCAIYAKEKFDALSPAEQKELLKRNAEIMNEFIKNNSTAEQLSGGAAKETIEDILLGAGKHNQEQCSVIADIILRDLSITGGYQRKGEQTGAVWVKATTRLPTAGKVTWRWLDKAEAYSGYDGKRGFIYGTGGASVDPTYYTEIEWLDETPTSNDHITAALRKFISMHESGLLPNRFTYEEGKKALEGVTAGNDAIKFAEWILKEGYYAEDGKWWQNAYAEGAESFTTSDLHQIWQQSKSK